MEGVGTNGMGVGTGGRGLDVSKSTDQLNYEELQHDYQKYNPDPPLHIYPFIFIFLENITIFVL